MAVKWVSSGIPGVRYYKHKSRKHGVKFDRYFAIRYQVDGARKEEGVGWASEGWTAEKAFTELSKLKRAAKTGKGETSLAEKRKVMRKRKRAAKKAEITFSDFFDDTYYPQAEADKDRQSYRREKSLAKRWIKPIIGTLPFKDISPIHLEKIKHTMKKAEQSPRSIQYALAVVRQVFNMARRHRIFTGENPVKSVKMPTVDNKRVRYFTRDEAETLLAKLKTESTEMYEMALLSLHCGLRASEIFRLRWVDLDPVNGLITIKNAKGNKTRFAYMTAQVKEMLLNKQIGRPDALLYPAPDGRQRREVPSTFARVVNDVKLNEGITDRRDKAVFHTLRHTYASWLVQSGEDLYIVKERLGHSTIAMTERYSHLSPGNAKRTVETIEILKNTLKQNFWL